MTLVEFLKARLSEEAAEAAMATDWHAGGIRLASTYEDEGIITLSAGLMLEARAGRAVAEVEAKRQLIEAADDLVREHQNTMCNDDFAAGRFCGRAEGHRSELLRLLALPYASHPDYDEEWRP